MQQKPNRQPRKLTVCGPSTKTCLLTQVKQGTLKWQNVEWIATNIALVKRLCLQGY